jgi:hypothetical protein
VEYRLQVANIDALTFLAIAVDRGMFPQWVAMISAGKRWRL